MRLPASKPRLALILFLFVIIQSEISAGYKSEIEITPEPTEETATKKSGGFFSGVKSFFRGSSSTSTTVLPIVEVSTPKNVPASNLNVDKNSHGQFGGSSAQKPPPLVISHAPLMPLGPRPDTPPTSPLSGNQHQAPQWPQAQTPTQSPAITQQQRPTATNAGVAGGQPNLPPGFAPYRPPKAQPSGLDLSYGGGGGNSGRPTNGAHSGFGLAPMSSTTTTTTTVKPQQSPYPAPNLDLRGQFGGATLTSTTTTTKRPIKEDFPALPLPRQPSIKEDFPALPTPKSPTAVNPPSPSAWNKPLSTPASPVAKPAAPSSPLLPGSPSGTTTPGAGGNRVSFVPNLSTTTVRPGFQSTGSSVATDDEISALTENLYTKEVNSQLNLINVNLQGQTRSIDSADEAPKPLLTVDEKALQSPTIAKMRALFNNYEVDTLVNEHVTPNEHKEENDFLDAIMATSVMRQAMLFLQNKAIVTPDPKTHRDLVKELWFTQYSRGGGKIGSSGFEHVFVNEVKNGTIIGFHNWVYINDEEIAGRFDYKGYMKHLDMGTKGKVLKIRFTHNGLNKPVNSMFVGTSPELEFALYTVCFKLRPDRTCPVSLGNSKFGIVTYSWRYRGKSLIGSAYPEI